jgi:hypothetical protein
MPRATESRAALIAAAARAADRRLGSGIVGEIW